MSRHNGRNGGGGTSGAARHLHLHRYQNRSRKKAYSGIREKYTSLSPTVVIIVVVTVIGIVFIMFLFIITLYIIVKIHMQSSIHAIPVHQITIISISIEMGISVCHPNNIDSRYQVNFAHHFPQKCPHRNVPTEISAPECRHRNFYTERSHGIVRSGPYVI